MLLEKGRGHQDVYFYSPALICTDKLVPCVLIPLNRFLLGIET